MPRCNNPDDFRFLPVKKAVGRYDYLAVGQIRKLRDSAAGFRVLPQACESHHCPVLELPCGERPVRMDVGECIQELPACRWREL